MFTNYQAKRTEFLKVASELDGNGTQPQTIGDGMALIKASLAWYLSQVASIAQHVALDYLDRYVVC